MAVDDLRALEHRELHDLAGDGVQVLQKWAGGGAQQLTARSQLSQA